MPSGHEMIELMHLFTFGYKAERAFSNYFTLLLWINVSETLLTLGLFFSFCAAAKRMGIAILQLVHLGRGALGVLYTLQIPRSQNLLASCAFKKDVEVNSLEKTKEHMKKSMAVELLAHTEINS